MGIPMHRASHQPGVCAAVCALDYLFDVLVVAHGNKDMRRASFCVKSMDLVRIWLGKVSTGWS